MTKRGQSMLKSTVRRSRQLSAESIAKDLQTWCGLQISTTTVHRELHGMDFHGRAAASKPSITKCKAVPWCKVHRHLTLEQYSRVLWRDQSRFFVLEIRWTCLGLMVARRTVLA
ncbi:unnamed protein product [Staurois parvus]|uniref:Transposase Tc1-like domain-containing protein n=1 Tax=Staurois parvus TaxID=386267 RepID=A0ABN9ASI5_9NEOB|nr:unnamed protein product [Staurois parvus]